MAVQAHLILKSKMSIGCHFGTFQLTEEGIDDLINDLEIAKKKLGVNSDSFISPENGQTYFIKNN